MAEANIINGTEVSAKIRAELKEKIQKLGDKVPGLRVILVGENPASQAYVRMKKKACAEIGIRSLETLLPADCSEEELIKQIQEDNANPEINGILLQLPLPKGMDEDKMLQLIAPEKDVDGFHPVNQGKMLAGLDGCFLPCTPYGVCELLKRYDIDTTGKHVVIVGRSNIVGKPLAAMLVQKKPGANATVTICHSRTPDLKEHTLQADILVAAIGVPEKITGDMVKPGAVVIDVGVNRVDAPDRERGYKLVGDVDFESAAPVASMITPVPGGVGPMTIAMLMQNTYESFMKAQDKK